MKRSLLRVLFMLAVIPAVGGCSSSKEDQPLELDSKSYMAIVGQDSHFAIKKGNGNYDVVPEDETIVRGGFVRKDKSPGSLVLTGLKPGQTKVTVTDKVTDEKATVTVYVSEPYFAIKGAETIEADIKVEEGTEVPTGLKEELEKNEPLGHYFTMIFVQGSDRLFVEIDRGSIVSLFEGTYEISGTGREPWLNISFDNETEEITREYLLPQTDATQHLLQFLDANLPPAATRVVGPDYYDITLTEYLTSRVSETYPEVISVTLDIYSVAAVNKWMNQGFITKYY